MAKVKKKGLREPEGAGYSARATRASKKKAQGLPTPREGEKLPFPPFLPDDPVEAEPLVRKELAQRYDEWKAGKSDPLPVEEAFAEVRRELAGRRKK